MKNDLDNDRAEVFDEYDDGKYGYDSDGIHKKQAIREQTLSDRSIIRMFEEGLGIDKLKYTSNSKRHQIQQVSDDIVYIAKKCGLYIPVDDVKNYGYKYYKPTRESYVYINCNSNIVTKVKDVFALMGLRSGTIQSSLNDYIIHNILFPNAFYTFKGVTEDVDGSRFIFEQTYISSERRPTIEQIDDYFEDRGFKRVDKFYSNEYLSITDVSSDGDNVLICDDDTLCFIDPVIILNAPVDEVLYHITRKYLF
jgi:hypothetical protein